MDAKLIVRMIVSFIAAANAVVAMFGITPLEVSEEQLYTVVSVILMIGAWVWGFWKNNNFTAAAKEAQEYLDVAKATVDRTSEEDIWDEGTNEE